MRTRRVRRREGGHSRAGRPRVADSRSVPRSRPCGGRRALHGGAVPAWADANRHTGVLGCVTARRSVGMSAVLIKGSRFLLLITALTPLAIEAALTVQAELQHRADEADALRAAHAERARYHADLARRRYLAVDPANRLVADTLEADWNTALRALTQAQDIYDQARKNSTGQLTDAQKTRIRQLATDLPGIWNDPATPARERKRITRLLLTDVTVTRTRDTITAHVRLPAGQHRTLTLPIPPTAAQLRKTPAAAVTAIDELLDRHTHAQIAGILNDRGLTSGEGRPFHPLIIRNIRDEYRLRSREQRLRDAGMLTLTEMAARLGVPAKTVKIWHHAGLITGHPYNDKGQCLYPPPGENPPARAQGRKLTERRIARHTPRRRRVNPPEMSDPAATVSTSTNNRTLRINPKRCSMQPEVSLSGCAGGSSPPRYRQPTAPRRTRR
jgi:hypothetical protein